MIVDGGNMKIDEIWKQTDRSMKFMEKELKLVEQGITNVRKKVKITKLYTLNDGAELVQFKSLNDASGIVNHLLSDFLFHYEKDYDESRRDLAK